MELDRLIAELKGYVIRNYEAGGHWAVETFGKEDYADILRQSKTWEEAKTLLRTWCELGNEREMDCAWDGPPEGYTRPVWEDQFKGAKAPLMPVPCFCAREAEGASVRACTAKLISVRDLTVKLISV